MTVGLLLGLAVPALALASDRVPRGVTKLSITLTFPMKSHAPEHRTVVKAAAVTEVVHATDTLQKAEMRGVCPMLVRLGPVLTVTFRNARGSAVAQAEAQVVQGTRGVSGSSPCFPIRFTRGKQNTALVGNGWVRMMGRVMGTAIS